MGVGRLYQQDSLSKVEHNYVVYDDKDRVFGCSDPCHRIITYFLVVLDSRVVVLAFAKDSVHLVFLDFIVSYEGITAQPIFGIGKDSIFIIAAKRVHQDMGLGGDSIDTALTVFYFTAFNF